MKHALPCIWRRKRSLGAGQASKEAWALKVCLDRQRAITQDHPSYLSTMLDAHPAQSSAYRERGRSGASGVEWRDAIAVMMRQKTDNLAARIRPIVLRIALLYYRTRTVRRTIDSKFYEKVGHFPQDPPCFCPRTGCHCLNAQHGCSTTPFLIVGRQQRAAASSRAQQMPQAAPNDRNEH